MQHDTEDVREKINQAVKSYTERYVARLVDAMEPRIAQKLANAGKPRLAVKGLQMTILDLCARVDDLEQTQGATQTTPQAKR